jgi:hypothetical protein
MNIDSVVSQLQKELSESRQSNSQLELDEVDCNMDLWYLRYDILVLKKCLKYFHYSTVMWGAFEIADLPSGALREENL